MFLGLVLGMFKRHCSRARFVVILLDSFVNRLYFYIYILVLVGIVTLAHIVYTV